MSSHALYDGAQGYQPNDRRHAFKLSGSCAVTEDWTYSFEVNGIAMFVFVGVFNTFDDQSSKSQNEHFEARNAGGQENPWFGAA